MIPLLEIKNLRKEQKKTLILEDVSLKIGKNEIIGLIGPNGAGKTSTFYAITGLIQATSGSIYFKNKEISQLPMYKRAQLGLGYLPQEESVFSQLTAKENLLAILEHLPHIKPNEILQRADELLQKFKLTKISNNIASTLSGGEKRRLTIARCLCSNPSLILLDEPFSGIDPISIEDIHQLIQEIRKNEKVSILITDHNVRETLKMTDRSYLILNGKTMIEGNAEEISNNPIARNYYLGNSVID